MSGRSTHPSVSRTTLALLSSGALIIAPIVGGALAAFGFSLIALVINGVAPDYLPVSLETLGPSLLLGAMWGGFLGVPPALVVGWPLHLLMLRFRIVRLTSYVLGAALIAVPCFALTAMMFGPDPRAMVDQFWAVIAVAGAIGGLIFWLIRRPDRDTPLTRVPSPKTSPR